MDKNSFSIELSDQAKLTKDKQSMIRTFTVIGPYQFVRDWLKENSWKEIHRVNRSNVRSRENSTNNIYHRNPCEPTLLWVHRRDQINFRELQPHQIVNHFEEAIYTTKLGLCRCLQNFHWFDDLDADNFFPRCYQIGVQSEKLAFIEDYHLTTCISIMKWVVDYVNCCRDKHTSSSQSEDSVLIPSKAIEAILSHCETFLKIKKNEMTEETDVALMNDGDWTFVMAWYFQLINDSVLIPKANSFYEPCVSMLSRMRYHWPQLDMDGKHNLWILKPAARSRGEGIKIFQDIKDIFISSNKRIYQDYPCIIQKYIERPLLIEGVKFDIRQWFLVTTFDVLTIYFYEDCYLRFCSRSFSLRDLSEAAHLCNNSVQSRYMTRHNGSSLIPEELMWSSDQFKEYLRSQGRSDEWDNSIYPDMKSAIIATVQSAHQGVKFRKNSFELYGADFMLSEDYHPWLLEINANPCMAPTTTVTARLCQRVSSDLLKVVLERQENPDCSIGKFHCIYKQMHIPSRHFLGISLKTQGVSIPKPTLKPLSEEDLCNARTPSCLSDAYTCTWASKMQNMFNNEEFLHSDVPKSLELCKPCHSSSISIDHGSSSTRIEDLPSTTADHQSVTRTPNETIYHLRLPVIKNPNKTKRKTEKYPISSISTRLKLKNKIFTNSESDWDKYYRSIFFKRIKVENPNKREM